MLAGVASHGVIMALSTSDGNTIRVEDHDIAEVRLRTMTLNKRNTFTDFISATETLIVYADPHAVFAQGGSAGGLLMGAIANLRPDLYAGIVAERPFVDVITTMSDPSVPLTTGEYDEWAIRRSRANMTTCFPIRRTTMSRERTIPRCSSPPGSTIAK